METLAAAVEACRWTTGTFQVICLRLLEAELGAHLLYRTTRNLSFSDEGSRFYDHCNLIITEAKNAKAEQIESQSNPQGTIRITLPQSLLISGAGDALLKF